MVEVRLHGPLAKHFGMSWTFDIRTPLEAVAAIEANRPGFRKMISDLADKGMVFRVRTRTHDYDNDDVTASLGRATRLDIIPIIAGSSAGVRFVIGAVLVVVGYIVPGAQFLVPIGISMMIGAVVEWLTPQPKKEDFEKKGLESWTISGPNNNADQGQPVPVIYGEVLTGGNPISSGLSVSQLDRAGSTASSVNLGGNLDPVFNVSVATENTAVLQVSGSPFNIDEPLTYEWSYSGFAGATVTHEGLDKATIRLHVTVPSVPTAVVVIEGSVTLEINGLKPGTRGAETPEPVTASVTKAVSVRFVAPPET
jgi:predicted phage tail protein